MRQYKILFYISLGINAILLILFFFLPKEIIQQETHSAFSEGKELKLFEYKGNESIENKFTGIISYTQPLDVSMDIDGKIENGNRNIKVGQKFKKDDILLKIDRVEILYQIIIERLEFKRQLREILPEIQNKFSSQYTKWKDFEEKIQHTEQLPDLPEFETQQEKEFFVKSEVIEKYFATKKIASQAEKYYYVAPFDGIIVESKTQPGATLKKGEIVLKIAPNNQKILLAALPFHILDKINKETMFTVSNAKNEAIGKVKLENWTPILSDSGTIYSSFMPIQGEFKDQEIYSLQIDENSTTTGNYVPVSTVFKDSVYLFQDNKFHSIKVDILQIKEDSVIVKGIPSNVFLLENPEEFLNLKSSH